MIVIDFSGSTFFILFIILLSAVYFVYRRKQRKLKFLVPTAIILYVMLVLQVTVFQIYIVKNGMAETIFGEVKKYHAGWQLIPFQTIRRTLSNPIVFFRQCGGNILLLLPVPVLIGIIREDFNTRKTFFIGVLLSICIELMQFLTNWLTGYPGHVVDVDDILLNGIGVLAGTVLINGIRKIKGMNCIIAELTRK